MPSPAATLLADLRRRIASIEAGGALGQAPAKRPGCVVLGAPDLDRTLGGGLARGALHEVSPITVGDIGAASGFVMGLAARARAGDESKRAILYVQQATAGREAGVLYPPGLHTFGLDPAELICIAVKRRADLLLAMEEALRCPELAIVVGELFPDTRALGLTASRRLALAAEAGGGFGLLLRAPGASEPGATATRWQVRAAQSQSDAFGGLGPPRLHAHLSKSKLGRTGAWLIEWSEHERAFSEAAVSRDLAAAPPNRPDRAAGTAQRRRAG